jgi:hypothetical protein
MAQITAGPPGSGSAGAFACSANVSNPTAARATGYAELIGDIVITCTGGFSLMPHSFHDSGISALLCSAKYILVKGT